MSGWENEYQTLERKILRFIAEEIGEFASLALEVYRYQRCWSNSYRKFCELRGVPEDIDDWRRIPAVSQQAFKRARLTVFPEERTIREFRTSGTTGEGYGSHYFCDLALYDAAIDAGWAALGLERFSLLALSASTREVPHSSLSYMLERLAGEACYLRNGSLEEDRLRIDLAKTSGPVILLGTALAFFNLMEKSPAPLPLPMGSVLFETGGYKGSGRTIAKQEFYQQLEGYFNMPIASIINEYGMTELSSQFYTRGLSQPHRGGAWIRFRVVNPLSGVEVAVGETGVLQLFDLANLGSVLAVQTEDLAIQTGKGFTLLGRDPAALARGCSRSVDEMLNR